MTGSERLLAVPTLLVREISGFRESPEYRLWADRDFSESTLLIGGALTDYLIRLESLPRRRRSTESVRATLSDIYEVIEKLAGDPDLDVQNFVQVDFFENLNCGEKLLKRIARELLPRSRAIFDEYN